jgi:hypothetical protein
VHELTEAVTEYCAVPFGSENSGDPRPRLIAGVLVGVETSSIELWGRSGMPLSEIFDAAEALLRDLHGVGPDPGGLLVSKKRILK